MISEGNPTSNQPCHCQVCSRELKGQDAKEAITASMGNGRKLWTICFPCYARGILYACEEARRSG